MLGVLVGFITIVYGILNLPSVQDYARDRIVLELKNKLQTDLGIEKLHFQPFNTIELRGVYLNDRQKGKILYADRLFANVDVMELLNKDIIINSVHLSDFEIFLSKQTTESPLNIQFVIDAFKSDKKDSKPPLFTFRRLSALSISNGKLNYDIKDKEPKKDIFDVNHISISNFDARLGLKYLTADSVNAQIKQLNFKEKSGFVIDNLVVRILKSQDNVTLKGFKLELPKTFVQFEKCSLTLPRNLEKEKNYINNISIDCDIASSYIALNDVAAFVPQLTNFKERFLFSTSVKGSLSDFSIKDLMLDYGDRMHLMANMNVKDADNKEKLYLFGAIDDLTVTKDGIQGIINNFSKVKKEIPKEISNLGTVSFKGEISGFIKDLLAKGSFATALGNVNTDLHFGFNSSPQIESFFIGNIFTKDFQLGKLVAQPDLDVLSFNLNVDVKKLRNLPLEGDVQGLIEQIDYKKYSYRNIELDGHYGNKKYDGRIFFNDENGFLDVNGIFDFSEKVPIFDFQAQLKNLKLDKLNLVDQFKESYLSSSVYANFSGRNLDELQGQLSVDSLRFIRGNKKFALNSFAVTASGLPQDKHLTIASDIVNGEITGAFSFASLIVSLKKTFATYLPSLVSNSKAATTKSAVKVAEPFANNLDLHLRIENTEDLSDILSLPVVVINPVQIDASYDNVAEDVKLDAEFPAIKVAGMNIENGSLHTKNISGVLQTTVAADVLGKKGVRNIIKLGLSTKEDKIDAQILFENNSKQVVKGKLSATTTFSRSEADNSLLTDIDINPSQLTLKDSVWDISQSHVRLNKSEVSIENFVFMNADKTQFLRADGTYSATDPSDILLLSLQNINLEYIFTSLDIKALEFGGYATGVVSASSIERKPYAKVNLKVKDFRFNQTPLGDLELFSDLDDETKNVNMHGTLYGEESRKIADINGYIDPIKQQLSLLFDADKINLGFLNKYAATLFNNIGGQGSGQVRLYGDFSNVTVEGKAFINDGTLGINFLNTTYTFSDSVYMKSDLIYFKDIKLHDTHGSTAIVSGQVAHNFFSNFMYQVNLSGDNFMLYNATEAQNPIFWGQVFGSGTGVISGDEQEVNIDMNIRTNENTKVRMDFMEESASEYSFISFKSPEKESEGVDEDSKEKQASRKLVSNSGMAVNMNFYVDATPDATVEILMDPVGGDILRGNGSGAMRFTWGTNSEPRLSGTYTIQSGSYNFTFQKILERRFLIDAGSTVRFNGDPFAAILDVSAIYKLNANLNDINQGLAKNIGQTSVPVQCILNLSGQLRHPNVKLDIALPSVDSEIQRQVKMLMNTEDMMNRQIVYLLLLSKFYTPSGAQTENQTSDLASVASATLSAQLSNILSQIDDRWQFGANVRTSDSEFTSTEVELMLSSHLLNDRLLINGNFGYRDNPQTQSALIGDVDIEYLLGKSNTWRIKAYNHFNEKYYYYQNSDISSLQTQGLGIMYKKDFDHVREIFGLPDTVKRVEQKDTILILPDSSKMGSSLGKFIKIK
ncbi:MAG: translocation/assembly module TamB domain-containing protein [Dysgonomonas sp.]